MDNVERNLKQMDVKRWRKEAKNIQDWVFVLRKSQRYIEQAVEIMKNNMRGLQERTRVIESDDGETCK